MSKQATSRLAGEPRRAAARRRRRPPAPRAPSARRARRPAPRSVRPPVDCMICGSASPRRDGLVAAGSRGRSRAAARARRRGRSSRCARTRGRSPRARSRATAPSAGAALAQRGAEHPLVRGGRGRSEAAPPRPLRARPRRALARAPPRRPGRALCRVPSGADALRAPRSAAPARTSGAGAASHSRYRCGRFWRPELDHVGEALGRDAAPCVPCAPRAARSWRLSSRARSARPARASAPARSSTAATARSTPRCSSDGVEGTLAVWTVPSGPTRTASVKVPPTSTPEEHARSLRERFQGRPAGAPPDGGGQRLSRDPRRRCRRLRRGELAVLGVSEVLVGRAVAVARERRALAGRAFAGGRAAARRRAADGRVALVRVGFEELLRRG